MNQEKTQEAVIEDSSVPSLEQKSKPEKRKHLKIILVISCVILLIILGGAGLYLKSRSLTVKSTTQLGTPNTSLQPVNNAIGPSGEIATIVALGGYYKDTPTKTTPATNSAEFYSFKTQKWEYMPPMNRTHAAAGAAVLGNKIYVFGGQEGNTYNGTNTVEMFDPTTNTWILKKNMPHNRFFIQALPLLGKIYILGGMSVDLQTFRSNNNDQTVDVYDPTSDSWSAAANIPVQSGFYTQSCAVVDNKIYCPSIGEHSYTLVYDPVANAWSSLPTQNRSYGTGWIEFNSSMYAPTFAPKKNGIIEYKPLTDSMTTKSLKYYIHHTYQAFGAVGVDRSLVLIGGQFSGAPVWDVYVTSIDSTQPWRKTTHLNLARASAATVVLPSVYTGNLPSARGASIGGLITEKGNPAPNIKVVLELYRTFIDTTTTTDQNGRYNFTGLEPGKYTIMVEQQTGNPGAFSVPMYKDYDQWVEVNEGDKVENYNYNMIDGI